MASFMDYLLEQFIRLFVLAHHRKRLFQVRRRIRVTLWSRLSFASQRKTLSKAHTVTPRTFPSRTTASSSSPTIRPATRRAWLTNMTMIMKMRKAKKILKLKLPKVDLMKFSVTTAFLCLLLFCIVGRIFS